MTYAKGDPVEAAVDIIFSDKTIPIGSEGTVTHNQGADIDTVRVKFRGDGLRQYRVVEEGEIKPR